MLKIRGTIYCDHDGCDASSGTRMDVIGFAFADGCRVPAIDENSIDLPAGWARKLALFYCAEHASAGKEG